MLSNVVKLWSLVRMPLQNDIWRSCRLQFKSCFQIKARSCYFIKHSFPFTDRKVRP